jgi:hypothetical protein
MKEIIPPNKTLTPEEYEAKLLEIENKPQQTDPLDVHAAMVKYYIPRLKIQINNLSKKQLLTMVTDLAGSSYNSQTDVNKIQVMAKDLGLGALQRVLTGAIVNPFDEKEINLHFDKEKKLFQLFDSLLTNKYFQCLIVGLTESGENKKQELEEFILHKLDTNSKEFKKRIQAEKDSFLTANKLLCSKFLMILSVTQKFREKEKENGTENTETGQQDQK